MHGQGNDYLFMFEKDIRHIKNINKLSIAMSERHFGAGADGIVILTETDEADIKMDIYNADGTFAEMCGTALRCTVSLIAKKLNQESIRILTSNGVKTGSLKKDDIVVNMGKAALIESQIVTLDISKRQFSGYYISMGNPHFVIFERLTNDKELELWGPQIEHDPFFINKTNVEFVEILPNNELNIKVWERGSGITLACGTGASASAFAAYKFMNMPNKLKTHLPGGELIVFLDKNEDIFVIGSVTEVYEGKFYYKEV
jgi:diaminopimelate epimerase